MVIKLTDNNWSAVASETSDYVLEFKDAQKLINSKELRTNFLNSLGRKFIRVCVMQTPSNYEEILPNSQFKEINDNIREKRYGIYGNL